MKSSSNSIKDPSLRISFFWLFFQKLFLLTVNHKNNFPPLCISSKRKKFLNGNFVFLWFLTNCVLYLIATRWENSSVIQRSILFLILPFNITGCDENWNKYGNHRGARTLHLKSGIIWVNLECLVLLVKASWVALCFKNNLNWLPGFQKGNIILYLCGEMLICVHSSQK